jgi:hypothetical protein
MTLCREQKGITSPFSAIIDYCGSPYVFYQIRSAMCYISSSIDEAMLEGEALYDQAKRKNRGSCPLFLPIF